MHLSVKFMFKETEHFYEKKMKVETSKVKR